MYIHSIESDGTNKHLKIMKAASGLCFHHEVLLYVHIQMVSRSRRLSRRPTRLAITGLTRKPGMDRSRPGWREDRHLTLTIGVVLARTRTHKDDPLSQGMLYIFVELDQMNLLLYGRQFVERAANKCCRGTNKKEIALCLC